MCKSSHGCSVRLPRVGIRKKVRVSGVLFSRVPSLFTDIKGLFVRGGRRLYRVSTHLNSNSLNLAVDGNCNSLPSVVHRRTANTTKSVNGLLVGSNVGVSSLIPSAVKFLVSAKVVRNKGTLGKGARVSTPTLTTCLAKFTTNIRGHNGYRRNRHAVCSSVLPTTRSTSGTTGTNTSLRRMVARTLSTTESKIRTAGGVVPIFKGTTMRTTRYRKIRSRKTITNCCGVLKLRGCVYGWFDFSGRPRSVGVKATTIYVCLSEGRTLVYLRFRTGVSWGGFCEGVGTLPLRVSRST